MTWHISAVWRYPIKGIGAEPLDAVEVTPNAPFPLDRAWAVLEAGGDTTDGWRACRNFLRGAKGPSLMAITSKADGETLILSHPERPDLSLDPSAPDAAPDLFEWLRPIYPDTRQPPQAIVKSPAEGMADAPFASVSVLNTSSLRAVSQKAGHNLDPRRFRGNIWVDGLAPFEEYDLVGKTLSIGDVRLEVIEPIERCRATEANPATGKRDIPMLSVLEEGWGHTEFGVYAKVTQGGRISQGDVVQIA